ncbi:MAG: hypothetical protein GY714_10565 [Desulfobacterales bacterium]|nr:hypothetical protein [Desulfobacterales bacterium]
MNRDEMMIIGKIVDRFQKLFPKSDRTSRVMDIHACHNECCKLKLEDLLNAEKADFIHDVHGIADNLNRDTIELENHFLPRYSV